MFVWSNWAAVERGRKRGSATFKRKRLVPCRFCSKICKNIQELRWHVWREHK